MGALGRGRLWGRAGLQVLSYLPLCPFFPLGPSSKPWVDGVTSLAVKLQGKLITHSHSQFPPPGLPQRASLPPRQGRQAPGSGSSPFPGESAHQTPHLIAPPRVEHPAWRRPRLPSTGPLLTTVLLISPISAVVGAIALAPDPQADAVVLATEGPVWRAYKTGCGGGRRRENPLRGRGGGPPPTLDRESPAPGPP